MVVTTARATSSRGDVYAVWNGPTGGSIETALQFAERQGRYAKAVLLILFVLGASYYAIGGILIWLQTDRGAFFDASPVPDSYFIFFCELTYLLSVLLWPALQP